MTEKYVETKMRLSPGRRVFAEELAAGSSRAEAAHQAWPSQRPANRKIAADRALKDAGVMAYIKELLLQRQCMDVVVNELMGMLAATRANGEPDWTARGKAINTLIDVFNLKPGSQGQTKEYHLHLQQLDAEPLEVLRWIAKYGAIPSPEDRAKLIAGEVVE